MSTALAARMEELRSGPRARWAAPPPAVDVGLAEKPRVLVVAAEMPADLADALHHDGYAWEIAQSLQSAMRRMRRRVFGLLVTAPDMPDGDMVEFAVALKAGHEAASGVPAACQDLPTIVLPPPDDDTMVALARNGDAFEVPRAILPSMAASMLRF